MDLTVLNLAVPRITSTLEPSGTQLLWIIVPAQHSLTTAVHATCAISAVISILTALAVAVWFSPRTQPEKSPAVDCRRSEPALAG